MEKSTGRAPQPRCDDVIIARVPSALSQSLRRAAGGNLSAYMRQALIDRLRRDGIDVRSDKVSS
jgi:hypothetical protein